MTQSSWLRQFAPGPDMGAPFEARWITDVAPVSDAGTDGGWPPATQAAIFAAEEGVHRSVGMADAIRADRLRAVLADTAPAKGAQLGTR